MYKQMQFENSIPKLRYLIFILTESQSWIFYFFFTTPCLLHYKGKHWVVRFPSPESLSRWFVHMWASSIFLPIKKDKPLILKALFISLAQSVVPNTVFYGADAFIFSLQHALCNVRAEPVIYCSGRGEFWRLHLRMLTREGYLTLGANPSLNRWNYKYH